MTAPDREVWDDTTDAEAGLLFATFPEREIRRRQALCQAQLELAAAAGDDQAVANLQRMGDALVYAMLRRCRN